MPSPRTCSITARTCAWCRCCWATRTFPPRRFILTWRANASRRCTPPITRAPERAPFIMAKEKHVSETPATQWLRKQRIPFTEHSYDYVDHGGASEAARQLGLDLHQVAKTLIMED